MDKIQIQFNESDYKVYYNYCERYYQIHDVVRKKSIHAFLDLYVKGILPVEEQDIKHARQVLSQKCQDLKNESQEIRGKDSSSSLLRMRACTDILLFCDDVEKMYRLYQKQGLVANYLVILGTFSKVIEAAENSSILEMYDLNNDVIEALAYPLAEIIRGRLGTDRKWHSVLRELTVIAARFNRVTSGSKFDLDILKLIGPAVVSRFSKDVETREILSVLPSYFEDSELEEFEALLDRTPDILQNELTADTNWENIHEPLKAVATAVAEQKERWTRERSKLSDQYSLAPPSAIQSSDGEGSSVRTLSPSIPVMPPATGNKVFAIDVNPEGTTHVDSPLKISPAVEPEPVKPHLSPYIPIIIGVSVIVLFILVAVILSGAWNPFDLGNSTSAVNGTTHNISSASGSTVAKVSSTPTKKPAATTAPKTTTSKPTVTPTSKATTAPKSYSSADIGNHLVDIAFGPDNSKIQKPTKDLIAISVSGSNSDSDIALLDDFISLFNNYSSTTKISSSITANSLSDISLVFLPGTALAQIKVDGTTAVTKDVQTGTYYLVRTTDKTYVNSDLDGNIRNRWILRAALVNLGFYGETAKYPDSLFYAGTNDVRQLSAIDLKALQFMYGKKIVNGMTRSTVKALF
jgi:hypothetical protein